MSSDLASLRTAAIAATLRSCQLFSGVSPADLAAIAAFAVLRNVPKGSYLFREGDPAEGFYVAQKGSINVHRVSATGKEQVIYVFRAGESFAEAAIATAQGYPANARAVEASSVVLVPKSPFLTLLAAELGTSSETLSRTFARLRDDGLLVVTGKELRVKNVDALHSRFRKLLGES